tara:strand:- start:2040 stop:3185 length:1146 start_codon:yes stop_codon:yes gene_type:complete
MVGVNITKVKIDGVMVSPGDQTVSLPRVRFPIPIEFTIENVTNTPQTMTIGWTLANINSDGIIKPFMGTEDRPTHKTFVVPAMTKSTFKQLFVVPGDPPINSTAWFKAKLYAGNIAPHAQATHSPLQTVPSDDGWIDVGSFTGTPADGKLEIPIAIFQSETSDVSDATINNIMMRLIDPLRSLIELHYSAQILDAKYMPHLYSFIILLKSNNDMKGREYAPGLAVDPLSLTVGYASYHLLPVVIAGIVALLVTTGVLYELYKWGVTPGKPQITDIDKDGYVDGVGTVTNEVLDTAIDEALAEYDLPDDIKKNLKATFLGVANSVLSDAITALGNKFYQKGGGAADPKEPGFLEKFTGAVEAVSGAAVVIGAVLVGIYLFKR